MERAVDYEKLDTPTSINGNTAEFARVTRMFQRNDKGERVLVQEVIDVMWNVDKPALVALIDNEISATRRTLEKQIEVREAQKAALTKSDQGDDEQP